MKTDLLDKSRVELRMAGYGVAPVSAVRDPALHSRVQDYRRLSSSRMVPLDKKSMRERLPQASYHVSRKIDGEFTVLVYRDGDTFTMNPGGTVRVGMPWMDEAAGRLAQAGVREALIAGELYTARPDGKRTRVHDVISVTRRPESVDDLKRLRFAPFDLLSLDGQPSEAFSQSWQKLQAWFAGGQAVRPVETVEAKSLLEVEKLFDQWVDKENAEGLVVRSETAGVFKVKPRHTLDVVVIGFTESTDERQGMLHDLLVAVMRQDGTLQVLSRVGGGFSDDDRRQMLGQLKDMVVGSQYAEVNAEHVAYQMVRPEWVIEVSCLDLVSETTGGGPINRMVLDWNEEVYHTVRRMPLVSVISPQFIRRRQDKSVHVADVRIGQVTDLVEVPQADRNARDIALPKSDLLRREVYIKQLKGETMVRKFVMWKTNKESEVGEFPAYVVHYTDFSPNRKAPLAREIRVSSSREQIDTLWNDMKAANVKQGWSPVEAAEQKSASEVEPPVEEKKASPGKAAAKKKTPGKTKEPATTMTPSERTTKKSTRKKTG